MSAGSSPPLASLVDLSGRCAVVTGGGRGIGAAAARRLSEAGAAVVVADLDAASAAAVVASLAGPGLAVTADLTDPGAPAALVAAAQQAFGGVAIWVSNAGIYPSRPLLELDDAEWRRVLDLNLDAVFRGAREAARSMIAGGRGGVIVNIASNAGMVAGHGLAHYGSSKAAVVALTKSLALELAPHGIRAVGIAPGPVLTEGLRESLGGFAAEGLGDMDEHVRRTVPLGRTASPDEIARVVLFCASDLATYVTGTTILVDGGQVTSY